MADVKVGTPVQFFTAGKDIEPLPGRILKVHDNDTADIVGDDALGSPRVYYHVPLLDGSKADPSMHYATLDTCPTGPTVAPKAKAEAPAPEPHKVATHK